MTEAKFEIEHCIFDFIGKSTHLDLNRITAETMLFQEGIFDSMGFVLLVDFLEVQFGIRASDDDLVEENFESVTAIVNYIQRKKTVKAA